MYNYLIIRNVNFIMNINSVDFQFPNANYGESQIPFNLTHKMCSW